MKLDDFSDAPVTSRTPAGRKHEERGAAMRTVHRNGPDHAQQAALTYLTARLDAARAKRDMGTKDSGSYQVIADRCRTSGTEDETGSRTWMLPSPVNIDGKKYTGFRLQARQPAVFFDEDAAKALIDRLPPEDIAAATHTEVVYDYDYLFLALQQKKINSEDLDNVLVTPGREFSLTVLEGK